MPSILSSEMDEWSALMIRYKKIKTETQCTDNRKFGPKRADESILLGSTFWGRNTMICFLIVLAILL
jgi:hypothetical protein